MREQNWFDVIVKKIVKKNNLIANKQPNKQTGQEKIIAPILAERGFDPRTCMGPARFHCATLLLTDYSFRTCFMVALRELLYMPYGPTLLLAF